MFITRPSFSGRDGLFNFVRYMKQAFTISWNVFFFLWSLPRIIEMNVKKGTIEITNPSKKEEVPRMFTYDSVYDWK